MKMPFGKHKGLEMVEIPPSYLNWLLQNCKMGFKLRQEVMFALGVDQSIAPKLVKKSQTTSKPLYALHTTPETWDAQVSLGVLYGRNADCPF